MKPQTRARPHPVHFVPADAREQPETQLKTARQRTGKVGPSGPMNHTAKPLTDQPTHLPTNPPTHVVGHSKYRHPRPVAKVFSGVVAIRAWSATGSDSNSSRHDTQITRPATATMAASKTKRLAHWVRLLRILSAPEPHQRITEKTAYTAPPLAKYPTEPRSSSGQACGIFGHTIRRNPRKSKVPIAPDPSVKLQQ